MPMGQRPNPLPGALNSVHGIPLPRHAAQGPRDALKHAA